MEYDYYTRPLGRPKKTLTYLEEARLSRIHRSESWKIDDGLDIVFELKKKKITEIPEKKFSNFEPYTWAFLLMSHPEYANRCPWEKMSSYQLGKIKAFQPALITPERIAHLTEQERNEFVRNFENMKEADDKAEKEFAKRSKSHRIDSAEEIYNEQVQLLEVFTDVFKRLYLKNEAKTCINKTVTIDIREMIKFDELFSSLPYVKANRNSRLLEHLVFLLEDIGWCKDHLFDAHHFSVILTIIENSKYVFPTRLLAKRLNSYVEFFKEHRFDVRMISLGDIPKSWYRSRMFINLLNHDGTIYRTMLNGIPHYSCFILNDLTYNHIARLYHQNGTPIPYCREASMCKELKNRKYLLPETDYLIKNGYMNLVRGELGITPKGMRALHSASMIIDTKRREWQDVDDDE